MRCSSLNGVCFSPTQKKAGSNLLLTAIKAKETKKSKEQDAPSIAHNA